LREAPRPDLLQAALAGVVCYAIGASANFYALTLIDASVERALLFSYPALVVLATWLLFGQRPGRSTLLAVALTWLGIGLVVGVFDPALLSQNLLGSLWVLFCSATIVYYFLVSARLTRSLGSAQFTAVAMTAAGLALAVAYQGTHGWQHVALSPKAWTLMLALVVFVTVLPLYLVAEGVRRIGAERGAIASTVGPPATAIMAVLLLGESISGGQLLGMGMIIAGILTLELASRRKRRQSDAAAPGS
ncbi:MAG: EamA family transporter, partial [Pseudomonadota bacterium]